MSIYTKAWAFSLDDALPGAGQAASLALVVLSKTKTATWDQLEAELQAGDASVTAAMGGIWLPQDQHDLLAEHPLAVRLVSPGPPARSIAVCPRCGDFFALVGNAPASCPMSTGCDGKPAKVKAARGTKTAVGELPGS